MMHLELKPGTSEELRKFGLIMGGMLILFFGLLIPWIWAFAWPLWPWVAAGVFTAVALIYPPALQPAYWLWMRMGMALGWLNTRILLGFVFYAIIMPIGFVVRLFHDPLRRRLVGDKTSYRQASKQPKSENLERPF